ncbi:MAG: hypothetical protein OXC28_19750 [Defluviicoccus sp.]|nr:hypothetical protein [Defluviicoccus sp.]
MDKEDFWDAVEDATCILDGSPFLDDTPAEAVLGVFECLYPNKDKLVSRLALISLHWRWAWEALSALLDRTSRNDSEPVPSGLVRWAADAAAGRTRKPTKGNRPFANRDIAIADAVLFVQTTHGLRPTRSGAGPEECCREGGSACDAVGVALDIIAGPGAEWAKAKDETRFRGYKNIERIWLQSGDYAYVIAAHEYKEMLKLAKNLEGRLRPSQ